MVAGRAFVLAKAEIIMSKKIRATHGNAPQGMVYTVDDLNNVIPEILYKSSMLFFNVKREGLMQKYKL